MDNSGKMITVDNTDSGLNKMDIKTYTKWLDDAIMAHGKKGLPKPEGGPKELVKTPKKSRIEEALHKMPKAREPSPEVIPLPKIITPPASDLDANEILSESYHQAPPTGSFPEWMTGEFDEDGNIVPYPGWRQHNVIISPTSDGDKFRKKYLLSCGSDPSANMKPDPGYKRAKIADTGPMYLKDEMIGTPMNIVDAKK